MTSHRNTVFTALANQIETNVDGTGDYQHDLTNKVFVGGWNSTNLAQTPHAVIEDGTEDYVPEHHYAWQMKEATVFIKAMRSMDDHTTFAADARELLADLERALASDHTLGGNAISVTNVSNEVFADQERERVGVVLEIRIKYRTTFTDPNTAGPA